MKTNTIVRALRNSTTPAATLAAWQNKPLLRRRSLLRDYYCKTATLAEKRKSLIQASGPEMSSPESETPYLWLTLKSPEIADYWQGRDFLSHRGWYTDDYQSDTFEAYAVELKALPGLIFEAVYDSCGEGLRVNLADSWEIDYSEADCGWNVDECKRETAKDAVRSADSSVEREAEEAREFYRKDQLEQRIEENKAELKTLRNSIRNLCHDLKALCPLPLAGEYPAAAAAVKRSLSAMLDERAELMAANSRMLAEI